MDTGHSAEPSGARADGTMPESIPNGPGAAAVLAAGIGALALGVFAFAGDASPRIGRAFNIWNPSRPRSGVTTRAVLVWLVAWYLLARQWATRDVGLTGVTVTALAMLAGALLLTFPAFMDLLQSG
jgi:hypothetical protein